MSDKPVPTLTPSEKTLAEIANQFLNIELSDFTTLERNIASSLIAAGYLKKQPSKMFHGEMFFVLVDK